MKDIYVAFHGILLYSHSINFAARNEKFSNIAIRSKVIDAIAYVVLFTDLTSNHFIHIDVEEIEVSAELNTVGAWEGVQLDINPRLQLGALRKRFATGATAE